MCLLRHQCTFKDCWQSYSNFHTFILRWVRQINTFTNGVRAEKRIDTAFWHQAKNFYFNFYALNMHRIYTKPHSFKSVANDDNTVSHSIFFFHFIKFSIERKRKSFQKVSLLFFCVVVWYHCFCVGAHIFLSMPLMQKSVIKRGYVCVYVRAY